MAALFSENLFVGTLMLGFSFKVEIYNALADVQLLTSLLVSILVERNTA
jgi:hypothetical protein